jgi:sarcosine oxidase
VTTSYDAIVLGLGGMGSAAACHLARRGKRVLGLEQFTAAHDRGSSHGRSRIIRQSYIEGPQYVPLLLRAYELWRELELQTGKELLRITGGLMIGRPESATVAGSLASAREHGLPHEIVDAAGLRRFHPFTPRDDEVALFDPAAGALFPEACILAHLGIAANRGADLRFETAVTGWRIAGDGVEVEAAGERFHADRLIVTAGAWAGKLLADLGLPLLPERNLLSWFWPQEHVERYRSDQLPVFIWEKPGHAFYGLPILREEGVKVGFHHSGIVANPDRLDRRVDRLEIAAIRACLRESIAGLDGEPELTAVCMYTNTPDEHFAVGLHPRHPQVAIAAGFSGHGFKFASVMGEILAGLALDGRTHHPLAAFRLDRFGAAPAV